MSSNLSITNSLTWCNEHVKQSNTKEIYNLALEFQPKNMVYLVAIFSADNSLVKQS